MDMLDLTKKLISYESTSKKELEMMKHISSLLNEKMIKHHFDQFNPGEYGAEQGETVNIYVECGNGQETLVLYAHTDVVNAERKMFVPRVYDGFLTGRGAVDMKTSLAGLLYVVLNDYEQLQSLNKRIVFAFIADEETSATGAKRYVEWSKGRGLKDSFMILMEPSDNFTKVKTGGKGYIFLDLEGRMEDIIDSYRKIMEAKPILLERYKCREDGFGHSSIELTKIAASEIAKGSLRIANAHLTESQEAESYHASIIPKGLNPIEIAFNCYKNIFYMNSDPDCGPNSSPKCVEIKTNESHLRKVSTRAHVDIRTNLVAGINDALKKSIESLIHPEVCSSVRDYGLPISTNNKLLIDICKKSVEHEVSEEIAIGGTDAPYFLPLTGNIILGFGPGITGLSHNENEKVSLEVLLKTPYVIRKLINNYVGS